jgi:hypothetical protein
MLGEAIIVTAQDLAGGLDFDRPRRGNSRPAKRAGALTVIRWPDEYNQRKFWNRDFSLAVEDAHLRYQNSF